MTRNALSFVLSLGFVGGLLVQSASAQSFSLASVDGVRTACGPNGRDGSTNTGWNGGRGNGYGYHNASRYDASRYGSNYGSSQHGARDVGRYTYGDVGYGNWNTSYRPNSGRFARGYGADWRTSPYDNSYSYGGRRGAYDDYRFDRVSQSRHTYDRRSPNY